MSHRLALFDFDGTLADSQDWFLGIFDQVADRFGYRRLAPGDRERLRGLDTKAILHELGVPTWKLPMIAKHVRELARRDIDQIRLFPGAAEMLAALKAAGVAGGGGQLERRGQRAPRPRPGRRQRRCTSPAAPACSARRPRSAAFSRPCAPMPRSAILVGDETRDAAAARDVGIDVGLVAWGYADPDFLRSLAPTLFFERMDEIAPALIG